LIKYVHFYRLPCAIFGLCFLLWHFSGTAVALELLANSSTNSLGLYDVEVTYNQSAGESFSSFGFQIQYDEQRLELSNFQFNPQFDSDGLGGGPLLEQTPNGYVLAGANIGSSTPQAGSLLTFRAEILDGQAPATLEFGKLEGNLAGFTDRTCQEISAILPGNYMLGENAGGSIVGTVWFDTRNLGTPDGVNMASLAFKEVRVLLETLNLSSSPPDYLPFSDVTTDALGLYEFDGLPAGEYLLHLDESTIPTGTTYTTDSKYIITISNQTPFVRYFGLLLKGPSAVELQWAEARVDQDASLFEWLTIWEDNVLGFFVSKLTPNGPVATHEQLVLAKGGGRYKVLLPDVRSGVYLLEELSTNLDRKTIAILIPALDSPPKGEPIEFVPLPYRRPLEWMSQPEVNSYLVQSEQPSPAILDITVPFEPMRLIPETVSPVTGAPSALYFSPDPGRRLRLQAPTAYADELLQSKE